MSKKTLYTYLLSMLLGGIIFPSDVNGAQKALKDLAKWIALKPGHDEDHKKAPTLDQIKTTLNIIKKQDIKNIQPLKNIDRPFSTISPIILSYIILFSDEETIQKLHTAELLHNSIVQERTYTFVGREPKTWLKYYGNDKEKDGLLLFLAFALVNPFMPIEQYTLDLLGLDTKIILENEQNKKDILKKVALYCTDKDNLKQLLQFTAFIKETKYKLKKTNETESLIQQAANDALESLQQKSTPPTQTQTKSKKKQPPREEPTQPTPKKIEKTTTMITPAKKKTGLWLSLVGGGIAVITAITAYLWHKKLLPFQKRP